MKCLVTGGGGFIGSAIVTKLVEQGHNVVVMGRFNRPHCIATEIANQVEIIQGSTPKQSKNADEAPKQAKTADDLLQNAMVSTPA